MAHLANQNLCEVFAFKRARAFEQIAQGVELAAPRTAPFDFRYFGEAPFNFGQRERWLWILRAQTQQHLDRLAEIGRRGENLLALILAAGHRGDDLPNRPATDLQPLLVALCERPADHEARGNLGLFGVELREEAACQFRHLQPALRLSQG